MWEASHILLTVQCYCNCAGMHTYNTVIMAGICILTGLIVCGNHTGHRNYNIVATCSAHWYCIYCWVCFPLVGSQCNLDGIMEAISMHVLISCASVTWYVLLACERVFCGCSPQLWCGCSPQLWVAVHAINPILHARNTVLEGESLKCFQLEGYIHLVNSVLLMGGWNHRGVL